MGEMDINLKDYIELIKSAFPGCVMLNREQAAKALGIGVSTLDLRIAQGRDIPRYIKMGDAKNSRIAFSVIDVAQFIYERRIKTC